jgi:hypothetical protein
MKFYGPVGQNQGIVNSPYPLKIAWNTKQTVKKFSMHEKLCVVTEECMKRVLDHYGLERIQQLRLDYFGGSLNVRKMRGGDAWSMHSWGIAIDWDPSNNQLKWNKKQASLAAPECDMFWKIWEESGALSLGKARDFDWMHVQFARI